MTALGDVNGVVRQALALLRAEFRKATPGEWRTGPRGVRADGLVASFNKDGSLSKRHSGRELPIYWDSTGRKRRFWEDARCIVAMRNTYETLLDIAEATMSGDTQGLKEALYKIGEIRVVGELRDAAKERA